MKREGRGMPKCGTWGGGEGWGKVPDKVAEKEFYLAWRPQMITTLLYVDVSSHKD